MTDSPPPPSTRQTPRLLPPVYFFLAVAAMFALDRWLPVLECQRCSTWSIVGVGPIVLGLVVILAGAGQFRRRGTTIKPYQVSSLLVTDGVFRFSRNPMYTGMVAILAGLALLLSSLSPWLVIPSFMAWITHRFIRVEEAMLTERFGQTYLDYQNSVRRWL